MDNTELNTLIINALEDLKAIDIKCFDVSDKTSVTDTMILATGNSTRQVKAIAGNVEKSLKDASILPLGVEGQGAAEWVLIDVGDIVVHVMTREQRDFYDLERLWTTPATDVSEEGQ